VLFRSDRICEAKIQPFIDKAYSQLAEYTHAYQQKMMMKREALCDKGIWTAKKRYILRVHNNEGVQYAKPKLKVMGLEMIKSSTPSACKEKLWEAIDIIFNKDQDAIIEFIDNFREEFGKNDPVDIAFPRGVNGLSKFSDSKTLYGKGTPIHVKGAILYNHYLKQKNLTKSYPLIQEGEKLKFTYLKQPNPFKDMVISFPSRLPKEFELQPYVDYDMQFDKAFLEPIKVILDCMNWSTEKRNSLESFFG
jgi:DNA polymerase elongation subunit (family B)